MFWKELPFIHNYVPLVEQSHSLLLTVQDVKCTYIIVIVPVKIHILSFSLEFSCLLALEATYMYTHS